MSFIKKLSNPIKFYKELSIPAKAGIWFLVCTVMQKGISAITTPIFTRLLTTAEYGDVSTYYAWADMLSIFITFGLSSTVYSRGLVQHEEQKKEYTSTMIGLSIVTTALSATFYYSAHGILNKVIGLSTLAIFSIYFYTLFNTVTEFWYQKKRVDYKYKAFVLLTVAMIVIKPIASIIAIYCFPQEKVWARILPDVVITVIIGLFLMMLMIRQGKKLVDHLVWKESLIFVLPLIPHYLSQRILSQSDRIMIKNMVGSSEGGIYSLAYSVGMLLTLLNTALNNTVSPWAFRKMKVKECRTIGILSEKLFVFFGLCVLSFSLIAPELVRIFASADYYEAIYIIPIIAISAYYMFMYVMFINFEYYSGKTQYVMIATVISALVNLGLNIIYIKQYGYIAAAYTTLACYILYAVGHYFLMKYICKKYMDTKNVFNGAKVFGVSSLFTVGAFASIFLYKFTLVRWIAAVVAIVITLIDSVTIVKQFGMKGE